MLILLKLVCGIMPAHIKTLLQPSKSSASHRVQALCNIDLRNSILITQYQPISCKPRNNTQIGTYTKMTRNSRTTKLGGF